MSTANPTPRVSGFSLSHAQVLDGTTSFLTAALAATAPIDQDVYGVSDASLDPNTDNYENNGDDRLMEVWSWFNYADLKVTAGYLSFPLISRVTGETLSSGTANGAPLFAIDIWSERSMNIAPMPMIVRLPSRDEDGAIRTLTFGLYRVQMQPINVSGGLAFKDGLKVDYTGRVLPSVKDELGNPFADGKYRTVKLLSTL